MPVLAPFASETPASPTLVVPVARVVDLLHVQHASGPVRRYAEAMRSGQRFPPISVIRVGGRFVVTDGHKRLSACKTLGVDRIPVEVWSAGRLLADLWRQLARHLRAVCHTLVCLGRGREGRRQARHFLSTTLGHWRRLAASLWGLTPLGKR